MAADKPFFDTNVLFYLLSSDDGKADEAEKLLEGGGTVSVQVLNEFAAVALRKTKAGWPVVHDALATIRAACEVVPLTVEVHAEGIKIAERHGFSIYDSLIIAAALTTGCKVLYSEDMQDQQVIGTVTISNPFKTS